MHNLKHKKIFTFNDLCSEVKQIHDMRGFGVFYKLGFTNGCFDLFHAGHAQILNSIKSKLGVSSKLIVAINSDASVRKNKGDSRPIITAEQRAYIVACHSAVDYVYVFSEKTVGKYLAKFRPDVWFKGMDYNGEVPSLNQYEANIARKHSIEVDFIPLLEGISSTNIIKKIK